MYSKFALDLLSSIVDLRLYIEYEQEALFAVGLVALLSFCFLLFAAIGNKKGRVFGIITAIFQPLGVFAAFKTVCFYDKVCIILRDMEFVYNSAYSGAYYNDDIFYTLGQRILVHATGLYLWGGILFVVMVLTLVYLIILTRGNSRALLFLHLLPS